MKRYSVLRILTQSLSEGDVGIFIGENICREVSPYHRQGNLYLKKHVGLLSLSLGMAMTTNRRIFIFCEDSYFLRNLSEVAHIGVSKCKNIFLVILVSGFYTDIGKNPTIFNSIQAPHSLLFNMGFIVHDYKKHFKNSKNPTKDIKAIWNTIRGPLAVILPVEIGTKDLPTNYPIEIYSVNDIIKFIKDESIPVHNYSPPVIFSDLLSEEER